ncbi:uncharacterized protein [Haliotis cracherodii]|uniref:uncharacterized protein n=1 Tax=Haliotis cracherodii TaxID=6455 RepID=UPI0039ED6191
MLNGSILHVVKEYVYLGILFTNTGSFCKAPKRLTDQASRAMYAVFRKIRILEIPIDCQLKLFDQLVQPVLLYGSEVWGFENTVVIERVHLKFCKYILKLKQSTPDYMVYGELGRYPLSIFIKIRMISYWCKLTSSQTSLSSVVYKLMFQMSISNPDYHFPLLKEVKCILQNIGFNYIWLSQTFISAAWLKQNVKHVLIDNFLQKWRESKENSSKGYYYNMFKELPSLEPYLLEVPTTLRISLARFRTANHRLPIETGRWYTIVREERKCTLCKNFICDEMHFLLECPKLSEVRNKFLLQYYCMYPSAVKFSHLMSITYKPILLKLAIYIRSCMEMFH